MRTKKLKGLDPALQRRVVSYLETLSGIPARLVLLDDLETVYIKAKSRRRESWFKMELRENPEVKHLSSRYDEEIRKSFVYDYEYDYEYDKKNR